MSKTIFMHTAYGDGQVGSLPFQMHWKIDPLARLVQLPARLSARTPATSTSALDR